MGPASHHEHHAGRQETVTPADRRERGRHRAAPRTETGRRGPGWLRILLPALALVVWVAVIGLGGPFFGRISDVVESTQSSFLPETAESTQVSERAADFTDSQFIPAIAVAQRDGGLTEEDQEWAEGLSGSLVDRGFAEEAGSPPVDSDDGAAVQIFVPMGETTYDEQVSGLRAAMADSAPQGLNTYVTGPAGFATELAEGFAGIDGVLLLVALAAVFLILVVVYRSPFLPVIVLVTAMAALCAAIIVVYLLASGGLITIDGQVQGILFILVVGAATDYCLLYTARYREALREHRSKAVATRAALRGTIEPVLASGGTVIAGLLCLMFSDLGSTQALGPAAATGIAFSMLAALTFLPAVLYLLGRAGFWPSRPRYDPDRPDAVRVVDHGGSAGLPTVTGKGLWARVGRFVSRRFRTIWIALTIALLAMAAFAPTLQASGLKQSETLIGDSPASDGQDALSAHFPGGTGSPITVIAPEGAQDQVAERAGQLTITDSITATAQDSPSGSLPLGDTAQEGPPGGPFEGVEPTVSEGDVEIQITLSVAPDSDEATAAVTDLRTELKEIDPSILVGGETATAMDTQAASIHDRNLIIPIILVVVTVILMLLLRSILAPVLLIVLTVISFASALGVSAVLFNHVFGFPGSDASVPLYAFVFLVALGIDYNIFLMSRVREESLVHGTRAGILRGLVLTGGVITSAGIVLAATFAALSVIPIVFMVQLAFIVAFGVLLDALLVRSLLVPALTYDMGRVIWWPLQRRIRG
ncbi:MMPL family transporter [Kocuria coralli]|uniref:MMPL family transporter n=1 Tax=Kocuria coralli TaxID=1461025 RepID=A0A5J5KUC9_9MICC|nr:MMPL family transporter [Kocuria coralli]KAA9392978.1 MMPL family transporter [Kocuria coralli]